MAEARTPDRQRWQRRLALLTLVLGLVLSGFFGVRAWRQFEYAQRVSRGEVQVDSLRGWMTLPYIATAYGVPEPELRGALGLPPEGFEARSLREWFHAMNIDPVEGRQRIEALILRHSADTGSATASPLDHAGRESAR